MISIDGLLPDYYISPQNLGLRVPTLTMMKEKGAYAEGVEGVYPTVTYPAHTTLITGARPAIHGIDRQQAVASLEADVGSADRAHLTELLLVAIHVGDYQ